MPENNIKIPESAKKKLSTRNSKNTAKYKDSERIKGHYFRTFYYSFAITFIILGLGAVVYFVYTQDKNIFGSSDRYYQRASEAIESGDFETAEKALESCIKFDESYEKARMELIELYEKEQKYEFCENLLEESLKLFPRKEYYYKKMISVLTKQNKISEAIAFSEGISSSYIVTKLIDSKPQNVNSTPDPGTYDNALYVKLTGTENSTVYYTTDGTEPNKTSLVYDPSNPIYVETGTMTIRAVSINDAGLISDEYNATYRIYNANSPYIFLDDKVEQMVRVAINKSSGTIYYRELENIKQLSNAKRGDIELTGEIKTLNDLLVMPNLTEISLYGETSIDDFSPILKLKQLTSLTLSDCSLDDESIRQFSSLAWLTSLNIDNNSISDISILKNMSILKSFSASNNMIKEISVISSLSNLKELNLSNNLITDIGAVSTLTSLNTLNFAYNLISDISPLSALTSVKTLNLAGNSIGNIDGISRLTKTENLILSDNPIRYLSSLSNFGSLTSLSIDGTYVTSIAEISSLETLTTLDCSRTSITDYSPLATMKIKNLTATQASITMLDSIALASTLEVLNVSSNAIVSVIPLTLLENLKVLNVSNNPVTDMGVLVLCQSLKSISCANTPLTQSDIQTFTDKSITVIQTN